MGDNNEAYVAAGAQVVSSGINYASAANTNKKQRKWAEEQYAKQRADALTDWHMQNDYNSPAAQMRRYQEAGLNKNLIYGSNQNGPVIRSTDTPSWKPEAPQVDLRGAAQSLLSHQDLEMRQAQTDNVKAQNKNILLDSILKAGQINQLGVQTQTSEFQLQQLKNLSITQLEQAQANLVKTRADTQFTLNQDERNAATTAQSLSQGMENILNLRATRAGTNAATQQTRQQIQNLQTDNRLKLLDEILKKNNIQPSDPIYLRMVPKLLDAIPSPKQFKALVDGYIEEVQKWIGKQKPLGNPRANE